MAIKIGDALLHIGADMSKLNKSLKGMDAKLNKLGKQMSLKLTLPLLAVGGAAFKMGGDFDQAFRRVNVMLKASADEAVEYKARILEISDATGKAAIDVANAYYQIVSAGYRGADSLDILETAMKGATGGAAQTEATTAALTKAMNIFRLEGVEGSSRAMDVFFGIVDTGLLSFEQMAQSFPVAASMAAGLGVSIEETGAALGTLTKVTGSTEESATALNATFTALVKPSEAMMRLYEKWGITSGPQAIEQFGGLAGVLRKLQEETGGEVDQLAQLFPNVRAIRAILPLVTTASEDFANALEVVGTSTGRTSEAFKEMATGPGFQWQQMMVRMKNSMIKIGDTISKTLGPWIQKFIDWIKNLSEWFSNLSAPAKGTLVVFAVVLAAIGPLLLMLAKAIQIVKIAQVAWHAVMMTNPIYLILAGIAALIVGIITLVKQWDKVTAFFKSTWEKIRMFFLRGILAVLDALSKFTRFIPGLNKLVDKAREKIANMIDPPSIHKAIEAVKEDYRSLAEHVKEQGEARVKAQKQLLAEEVTAEREAYNKRVQDIRRTYGILEGMDEDRQDTLMELAERAAEDRKEAIEDELEEARKAHDERIALLEDEYDARISLLDDETAAQLKVIQDQIDTIDAQAKEEERIARATENEKRRLELVAAVDSAETDEDRAKAEQDLAEFLIDLAQERLDQSRRDEKDALRDAMDAIRTQARDKRNQLRQELEEKKAAEVEQLEATVSRLEQESDALEQALQDELIRLDKERQAKEEAEEAMLQAAIDRIASEEAALIQFHENAMARLAEYQATAGAVILPTPEGGETPTPGGEPPTKMAAGGLIPEPTLLYGLKSRQAYGLAGEAGIEHVGPGAGGGYRTANIIFQVDSRTLARLIGQPLVDEIIVRTGAII